MAGILLNSNSKAKGFTIVSNRLLSASNLSLKAKGLYSYLCSKPDRWNFSSVRMANELKEGVDGIKNTLSELESVNLLKRRKVKDKNGNWNGVIYYLISPDDANLVVEYFSNKKEKVSGKTIEQRKEEFRDRCRVVYETKKDRMTMQMIKAFFEYWSETTYGGLKMRFEMQTAFDLSKRMETWIRNNQKFSENKFMSPSRNKKELQTQNT